MRFQILGPLRVSSGGSWLAIGAGQQRVVLAVLLAADGGGVGTEKLIDEIWGDHPPRTALRTVHGYVFRLRRLLGSGPDGPLWTSNHGYGLTVADGAVDADVFTNLAVAGRRCLVEGAFENAAADLSKGLGLWQGQALADVPAGPTVTAQVSRLSMARLDATEDYLDALLHLGRNVEVADEARHLVVDNPLRERLRELLTLALFRCGRRSEALAAYQDARRVLVAELGLEPGPRLRTLQQAILADDPDASMPEPATTRVRDHANVPAQLPADVATFTSRGTQLNRLGSLLLRQRRAAPVIATITGTAGVGKTALAVHWAHRVRDRFPDGQLYVNLGGYGTGLPLRAIDALARFLVALGVKPENVPIDEDSAAALYRSETAGRTMLILLDNALHPDQIRPLLPGNPDCLVVITSRDRLAGLVARDAAVGINLDVLTASGAQTLLRRQLGATRLEADPSQVSELARICSYLPLALRIAGAHLTIRPSTTIAAYLHELLTGDRLATLAADDDPQAAVRIAFDQSYLALPAEARRLFRRLGLIPGPDVTALAAAALDGISKSRAARLLDQLAGAHLIHETDRGRYASHDLLRLYAADRLAQEEPGPDRDAAFGRLHDYYLYSVDAAARLLYPEMLRLPMPESGPSCPISMFDSAAEASAWLATEHINLVAAAQQAAVLGPNHRAWQLADALRGYFHLRRHAVDWHTVATAALATAQACADLRGQAAAQISIAGLHWVQGRHAQALHGFGLAAELSRRSGWLEGEAAALGNSGGVLCTLGKLKDAADFHTQALELDRLAGRIGGQAIKLASLGWVYFRMGRLEQAAAYHGEAVAVFRQMGSHGAEARVLTSLGETYHALGRIDESQAALDRALVVHRDLRDLGSEGHTMRILATLNRDASRHSQAMHLADAAGSLADDIGDQRLKADALIVQADIHRNLGLSPLAMDCGQQAIALARQVGDRYIETIALTGLAATYHQCRYQAQAAECARVAVAIARADGFGVLERDALATLAAVTPAPALQQPTRSQAQGATDSGQPSVNGP